jgi:glycosyltransferase involved in cell wall biosynthesis
MHVSCYTDATLRAHLDKVEAHHVASAVTVVIAAKQEAPSLGHVIDRARRFAGDIVVVVGRSTDGTDEVAAGRGARVVHDGGKGKGEALRCAIPHVGTPVTVFIDADGSHDPEDIPLLVEPILADEADHVSASRLRGGSSELHGGFDEFLRLAGSSLITACINWRYGCRLSESQNGYRAIRTEVLRALDLRENTTTIEQEMIIKTLKRGYRMAEVPSHEHPRTHGQSHISVWRSGPRYVYSLVRHLLF